MKLKKVFIEITNRCNLNCSFCHQKELSRTPSFMPVELFKKIASEVTPATKEVCLHLMGEPLMHPEFSKIVRVCEEFNLRIYLVTNGLLFTSYPVELFSSKAFSQINFSVHSLLNCLDWEKAKEVIIPLLEFSNHIKDQFINYRFWAGEHEETIEFILDFFKVKKISRENKNFKLKRKTFLHFDTEFTWPILCDSPNMRESGFCHALSSHVGILVDGTVVPCCLDSEGVMPLGNLGLDSLETILKSEKSQRMLKGFSSNKLLGELCKSCSYIERFL